MTVGDLKEILSDYPDDRILTLNWMGELNFIREAVIIESAFEYNECEYLSLTLADKK